MDWYVHGGLPCARVRVREPHQGTGRRCAEGVKPHWLGFGDIPENGCAKGYTYITSGRVPSLPCICALPNRFRKLE